MSMTPAYRGLDNGLAKAAPSPEGLNQKNYRNFRRRMELFKMQCNRRGRDAMVEGALLVISRLQDVAWDATEQLRFEEVENAADPFQPLLRMLDELYQYEDLIEVSSRCEEFFSEFQRNKGEELQAYIVRHRTMLKRMKEVAVEVPTLLSGWHLLTRSGVPRWTYVQVKSMCGGDIDYEKVVKALIRMFGGDSKPNPRDLSKSFQSGDAFFEDEYDEEFYEEDFDEWQEGEVYYEDDIYEEPLEEEIPLARGFYPVMAIPPEFDRGSRGKGDGKPKGKGKGKGKSKGKSKGKGSSSSSSF